MHMSTLVWRQRVCTQHRQTKQHDTIPFLCYSISSCSVPFWCIEKYPYPLFSTSLVIIARVRPYIRTVPDGPIFQAGTDVVYRCKVTVPGSFTYSLLGYCLSGGSEQIIFHFPLSTDTPTSFSINSTPKICLDIMECMVFMILVQLVRTDFIHRLLVSLVKFSYNLPPFCDHLIPQRHGL